MYYVKQDDLEQAHHWLAEAAHCARQATCSRRFCGSVLISHSGVMIGRGYNSPPHDESHKRCLIDKDTYHRKVTDKTCCMHAEQRAIFDALQHYPEDVKGSRLFFVSVGGEGDVLRSAEPYCTVCSKLALDMGVAEFVLWHEAGIGVYETGEYNALSFDYQGSKEL